MFAGLGFLGLVYWVGFARLGILDGVYWVEFTGLCIKGWDE